MLALARAVHESNLEPSLHELVKVRASQINGCAYCLDMHTKVARSAGETEERLYGLAAWRDAPWYTERERAALALTEAATLVADGVPNEAVVAAAEHFEPDELVALLYAIVTINAWNRLAIVGGLPEPGSYQQRS
jgi:AhpD family alkylhydroperoxidase